MERDCPALLRILIKASIGKSYTESSGGCRSNGEHRAGLLTPSASSPTTIILPKYPAEVGIARAYRSSGTRTFGPYA